MRTDAIRTKVIPGLLSGTSRQPLQVEGTALAALSLAGQALRFERPAAPTEFVIEASVHDDRRIVPESVRKSMIWLLRTRRLTEDVELALAWTFSRLNLRPHPFDLPRLGSFAKAYAEELGTGAQAWAQRESAKPSTAIAANFFFRPDEIDATNWTSAPPAQRVNFVTRQRSQDPVAALELIRSAWTNEDADMRVRLLNALASNLTPEDKPFLDELQKDRAPRVRDLAQRLLCRLPGSTETHPALADCLERIERSTAGLLRHKAALTLQLPATVKEHQAKTWIRDAFANVGCDELARALNLTEAAMIEAAAKDPNLLLAIALIATQDRRLELLELVVKRLPDTWEAMAQCGPLQLEAMSPDERARWAETLHRPYGETPPFNYAAWNWMHRALCGPLPAALIAAVQRSPEWRNKLQESKGSEWMELLAACCPSEQRRSLRGLLETIDPSRTVNAFALLDILDGMERG